MSRRSQNQRAFEKAVEGLLTEIEAFTKCINEWFDGRNDVMYKLGQTANDIDEHYRNCNIAKATGAGTATVGLTMMVAGILFPPAAAVGLGVAAVGSLTSTGASIADTIIQKIKNSDVVKLLEEDERLFKRAMQFMENIDLKAESAAKLLPGFTSDALKSCLFGFTSKAQVGTLCSKLVNIASGPIDEIFAITFAGKTAISFSKVLSSFLAVAAIPFTVAELTVSILELIDGSSAPASDELRRVKSKLKEDYDKVYNNYQNVLRSSKEVRAKMNLL